MIKTAVCGANGKVGKEVVEAVQLAEDTELVAKIDINNGEYVSVKDALEHQKLMLLLILHSQKLFLKMQNIA